MDSEQRDSFLKDEYILLQNLYEDYDRRSITIKGWVASGAIVAIALGFNESYSLNYLIPIAVAIVTISIWYVETYWKMFQAALRPRIKVIEAHFRSDPYRIFPDPAPFQSYDW
ncbi:hypothetical protein [Amaricoccus sp.]|uniref:hypothetical protein n=1 Tax=Amaricoccus sp. TaxID=1872485 RepID=UPI001B415D08|nr:hypothetical protein [Amaricoccus sp.]MBP7000853.1 hypothetical protein [Amaricoccus sp.]